MSIPAATAPQATTPRDANEWLTIAQLVFSLLAFLVSLGGALVLLALGLGIGFDIPLDPVSASALVQIGWISALAAVLCLPSLLFSVLRLLGRPVRSARHGLRMASLCLLLWPLVLAVGLRVPAESAYAPWLLPPLSILGVVLPVWWLVEFAQRKIAGRSAQRGWGLLLGSAHVTMALVLIAEVALFILLGLLAYLWISARPELSARLEDLFRQIIVSSTVSPEEMGDGLRPLLQNPLVLGGILSLLALLVPMMEEALKPLAMLALWSRRPSPAQGFAAGAICGGVFAALETLFSVAGPASDGWVGLAVVRTGTALLHVCCSALVGWGLAKAWHGQGGKLLAAYAIAVFFHGTWNMYSVFTGLGFLAGDLPTNSRFLNGAIQSAPGVLVALVCILFSFLWRGNQIARQNEFLPPGENPL